MMKVSIHQEDLTIINMYSHNIGAPKSIKQILIDLKGEIDSKTIIVGDFNILISFMARITRQKKIEELNNTIYRPIKLNRYI